MSGHTDNDIAIDAPFQLVWDITNDVAHWPTLFSEYAEATVLEQEERRTLMRLALHPDADGRTWSWVSERVLDPVARTVHARRVETGNFKYMWLFWEYLPEGESVRLRWVQDFELKPGLPLDDAAMTDRLNTNSAAQLRLIKKKIEVVAASGATTGHR